MGKRRRERDKPKAGPDAFYNPNKRVLLSYASDDEQEDGLQEPVAAEPPAAVETVSQITPYANGDGEGSLNGVDSAFAEARDKEASEDDVHVREGQQSMQQANEPALFSRGVSKNPSTNQWPALGSVSFQWDEEDGEYEEYDSAEEEAMAYLRGVRSERQNMPTVIRAPQEDETTELYESGVGDGRGYVSEGTYIGRPSIGPIMPETAKTSVEPQEAYTNLLKQRFLAQRAQMHMTPGAAPLANLDDDHPITMPERSNKAYAEWQRLLRTVAPMSAQVRAMDVDTVIRLLQLVQRMHLRREHDISSVTSSWIWSLLARSDDVGTMNNDEVYAIRDLGKKAVLVQLSFDDPVAARQLENVDKTEKAASVDSAVEIKGHDDQTAGNADGLVKPKPDHPTRQNTLATLDMIITVVGEVFGQRDLLEFRKKWEADEAMQAQDQG